MDLPSRGGRAPGSQANGSFPKGTGRLSEKSPAGYPPPHHRDDTPGSAGVARVPSRLPAMLQQPPVLIILREDLCGRDPVHRCSIYSPSRWICPVAGGGGRPARRQTGVSQRGQAGFQRSRPPDTPHLTIGTTPPGARASRPHAVPSVAAQFPCDVAADRPAGGNRMGPAEAEAGRRCRLIPVEEMAEAAGGFVRAGRPRSRGGFLP